jgi:hypothetical protein
VCAKPRKRKKMRENQRNELRVVSLGSWHRLRIHTNSEHFTEEEQESGVKRQMSNEVINFVTEELLKRSLLKLLLFLIKSYETSCRNRFYCCW